VGHLDYFHSWAIVNSAAVHMGVQVLLLEADSQSFGYISRSGIAGLYDRSIFSFIRSPLLFSIVVVLAYILTSSV
jgi:hypothetical protein